jgi:hypothetical protein
VLAAAFIIFQAKTCFALDRPASFWNEQSCGFKEVELDQDAVPEKVWNKVALLMSKNRSCFGVEPVDGRLFSFCVKYDSLASSYRVRSIQVRKSGALVYSGEEKICQ